MQDYNPTTFRSSGLMMKFNRIKAIIGVKSNIPNMGMTRRIGAKIGSVIWCKITLMGSFPPGEIHDMTTRPTMAMFRAMIRKSTNVSISSVNLVHPASCTSHTQH